MHVISVISTKVGKGKSTHTANISGFCADTGLKTLLIDGDYAQPTVSSYYSLRYEAPCGLYELLMRMADLNQPEQLISHTNNNNLDLIISNDPHEQLKTSMMHIPDGRIRLSNLLMHPLFQSYDVIVLDSQGARPIMLELVILATNHTAVSLIKPIVPDVREFLRGTITLTRVVVGKRLRQLKAELSDLVRAPSVHAGNFASTTLNVMKFFNLPR